VALDGQESLEAIRQHTEERVPDPEKSADKAPEKQDPSNQNRGQLDKPASDLEKDAHNDLTKQAISSENQVRAGESASDSEKVLDKELSDARAHHLSALKGLLESRTDFPTPNLFSTQTDVKAYPHASGATISGGEKHRLMIEHRANTSSPGSRRVRFSALPDRVPEPLPG